MLAIVPAVVVATAFDVEVNSDSEPSGWVLLAWIAGYLLQFGVFMVVAVKASANGMLGWLIASLVPWSANWAATVSMWWLLPCAAVIVGYPVWLYRRLARGHALQRPDLHRRGDLTDVEFAAAKTARSGA